MSRSARATVTRRRAVFRHSAVLAGSGVLMACGVAANRGATEGQRAVTLAPASLVFIDPDGATLGEIKQAATGEFQTRFPSIKVERVFGEGAKAFDKVQTMIAGGAAPDVFWSWGYWKNASAFKGLLRPFDDFVAREPAESYTKKWTVQARESGLYAGKLFGFVTQLGVPGVYVNEDLFRASGVALPPKTYGPQNWSLTDFLEAARRLTQAAPDGTQTQVGTNMWGVWWAGFNWIVEAFNGAVFDPQWKDCWLDHQEAVDALTWLADLSLKHRVAPVPDAPNAKTLTFDAGKSGMAVTWAHAAADHVAAIGDNFKWNIYPLPRGVKQLVSGCSYNWYCLPAAGKQHDAAWQFIREMASPMVVQRFLAKGSSFPFMAAAQDAMWQDFPQLNKQMALDAMPLARTQPLLPRDPEIEQAIKDEVNPAFAGQRSMREALVAARRAVVPLL